MNALIDTELLVAYLNGDAGAARALQACAYRSITVLTWLEVMRRCPPDRREATRAFLRSFERLSISESTADEALRLSLEHGGLEPMDALNRASAAVNHLDFVTRADGGGDDPPAAAGTSRSRRR
jgi:hypothetical protein